MKKLRVFETFAGIGAQHKALERLKENNILNYEIVATSEWDIDAILAYDAIHTLKPKKKLLSIDNYTFSRDGKTPTLLSKVEETKYLKLKQASNNINNLGSITEIQAKDIPDFDLLTYSFPCQDLSIASMGRGKGMKRGEGTRSGLVWEIERILRGLKREKRLPKYLLMENVQAICNKKNIDDLNEWFKFLESLGYYTHYELLNAIDFGIPQKRIRFFAVSILNEDKNIFEDIEINYANYCKKHNIKKLTLENMFKVTGKFNDELALAQPNDTPSRRRMREQNAKLETKGLEHIRTLTTKQDRHPNAGMKEYKAQSKGKADFRFLTPRECYMLMGFESKDFDKVKKLDLSQIKLYQQAGNSIVVNVLEAIFLQIAKYEKERNV